MNPTIILPNEPYKALTANFPPPKNERKEAEAAQKYGLPTLISKKHGQKSPLRAVLRLDPEAKRCK